ncbi:unnamed protein product, partial [Mesorhabditis belari]|uniref:V-SNARE coiled-coil homology domain-containing protein n=1 Tax=Mesorhabditis belari TaxID=2138241 RepID=A0AAF3FAK6_9BILA
MERAKRRFASALDGLRSLGKVEVTVDERIQSEHCAFFKIVRHGFPDDARCIAYDPVQRLLAIGTGHGTCRIIGDVGVDYLLRHETDHPVLHAQFLINEGGLITACANDMIHLWNFRQKRADIVHSLQLNKESVTCIHLPLQSKWLFVGTDKGNVYSVSVGTFQMSSYVINWNKAIDLSCRVHPGSVKQLSACPIDPSRLLIVFEKGVAVVWNLSTREADRFPLDPPIKCASWHYDGRQVMCGNVDGSVSIFNARRVNEPVQRSTPHGQGPCRAIHQLDWRHWSENNEQLVIFSGGMPTDDGVPVPALTLLKAARSATVLEMDNPILSFITLPMAPWPSSPQQPHAVVVLLKGDIMYIDLQKENYPCLESPHAMDLHESPVTAVSYHSECPSDLMGALALVGCKQRKKGFSDRQWPINGGVGREAASGYQELLITGHKDGTVRFWQSSGEHLQILYRLKTASHFERLEQSDQLKDVSHSVNSLHLCPESRLLLVTGQAGQSTLFRFNKTESTNTIAVVSLPSVCTMTSFNGQHSSDDRPGPSTCREMRRQKKFDSRETDVSTDTDEEEDNARIFPFKVRGAAVKRSPGFQPELICMLPWPSSSRAPPIQCAALNSAYGVIAIASQGGLALVDIAQCALIYAWATSELYGAEPTPNVQLNAQDSTSPPFSAEPSVSSPPTSPSLKGASSQTGIDILPASRTPQRAKTFTGKSRGGIGSIFRRNTSEMSPTAATNTREKYKGRGGENHEEENGHKEELERPVNANRSQSVKTGGGPGAIMRRLTNKKKAQVQRSHSFHEGPDGIDEATTAQDVRSQGGASPAPVGRSRTQDGMNSSKNSQRPLLAKAQSLMEPQQQNGDSSRESPREPSRPIPSTGPVPSPTSSQHSFERSSSNVRADYDGEFVSSLSFIHASTRKNDAKAGASLWVGTSNGACGGLSLLLPQDRLASTVVVAPSGTVVRNRGQVLHTSFMDGAFCLLAPAAEPFRDASRDSPDSIQQVVNRVRTKTTVSPTVSNSVDLEGSTNGSTSDISQVVIVVAEWEIRVLALPSFSLIFHHKCDEIPIVKALSTHVIGQPVLICLSAAGQIQVLSLPSLRPLLSHQLIPHSLEIDDPIVQKTVFSEHGLGVYMASPSEIEKFTVCAELGEQVDEALGELFVPVDMPEPPKQTSLLKGGLSALFSANSRQETVDLDTLFSDRDKPPSAATSMRSVAKMIPGPSISMDRAHQGGVSAGMAAQMAMQNLSERGERLNQVVDTTENLKNSAQSLSSRTGKLVEKYEKKKWYNF